jgi:hypothetical protein
MNLKILKEVILSFYLFLKLKKKIRINKKKIRKNKKINKINKKENWK